LRSIFLRVGLSDRLTVAPGGADGSDTLSAPGLDDIPVRSNLVQRALDAVRARAEAPLPALDAALEKRIPVAAGLGGGSSDCASAIKLAQAAWGIGLADADELALGARLGADVPFFLGGHEMAFVEGVGERVTPMRSMAPAGLLLLTPAFELSTARVFERFDVGGGEEPADFSTDLQEFPDLPSAASRLRDANDLWPAAASLAPQLVEIRETLETSTARPWLLSGSGPTLFALYSSAEEAADSGRELVRRDHPSLVHSRMHAVDTVGPDPAWRYP
jgi:4-diphosphocytidyl-2-C-methyl-D-erythritol kinase